MQRHAFRTPIGEIWLWGEADALTGAKPVVLMINGAFSIARPRAFELPALLPEAAVMIAHLPGNHSPQPASHSVEAYAEGFSAALDRIGRPAVVVGCSVGALVGLAMTSPRVRGLVIVEPPLLTEKLWCLLPSLQAKARAAPDDPDLRAFLWNVFGVAEAALEPRDHRPLVTKLSLPSWAMFGGEPLMPERATDELPSLVDEPERDLLRSHPGVETRVVPTVGHNVPGRGITFVRTCARSLLQRLELTRPDA